ncbi:MAG: hypothetical protein HY290_33090 [Planctomycetia bacterium]|nr:hypothetical protein [Planctomycetia bacterium]
MRHAVPSRKLLLIAGILCGSWCCGIVASAGQMRVDQWRRAEPGAAQFIAIMGEVARPGVFELSGPLPELAEFLQLAGGTSPTASGSVRILRAGRMMQLFLSPRLRYSLLPNDLVIVESKQFSTVRDFADSGSLRARDQSSRPSEPSIVQLGLVNLIGRPVVLDVSPGQSQLNQVLLQLHQAASGAGSMTLIKPGSGMQEIPLEKSSQMTLTSGTVLVFNSSAVNVGALPRLPNTVKPNPGSADAAKSIPLPAESQTRLGDAALHVPSEPTGDRPMLLTQAASGGPTRSLSASSFDESTHSAADGATPRVVDLSAAGDAPVADSTADAEDDPLPEVIGEPDAAGDAKTGGSAWKLSSTTWTALAAMILCGLAPLAWLRRKSPVRRPATAPEAAPGSPSGNSAPASAEIPLETLISGSMTIVEEPLELPLESKIFGRPAKRPSLVFDRAHDLAGPHYELRELVEAPATAAAPEQPLTPPIEIPRERRVRVDKAHPKSDKGVLDRALATFEGEHS